MRSGVAGIAALDLTLIGHFMMIPAHCWKASTSDMDTTCEQSVRSNGTSAVKTAAAAEAQSRRNTVQSGPGVKLTWRHLLHLGLLASLAIGMGLGSATRLTYHEALIAQGAREMLISGNWWYPSIGDQPWLEKPPLPFWLVACLSGCAGTVSPFVARLPSAIAALLMILGVVFLANRYHGPAIGLLSGAIQTTTAWTVLRGRLAEADMLLACLIVWTLLAFDRLRADAHATQITPRDDRQSASWQYWRWIFFALLGTTTLVKGTGFGAALVLAVVLAVLLWDRDRLTGRRLLLPAGWILVMTLALSWPLAMIAQHGFKVVGLWTLHITGRH